MGNNWQVEVSHPTDHVFEQFKEMKWGVRAAFIVLRNYIVRHKCNTIAKIVSRWAPNNENNTEKYIKTVCERTGFGRNDEVRFDNACQMIAIFLAMTFVENGREIDLNDVVEGWLLANK
ncbi:hypothetical protein ACQCP7_25470 [Ralstonia pseudosolanacearum]|uniref:hypothetical protein n=1 Tax=Ralstonia pseudosolanacearum TaxID=1310165 RepID=UPI003CEF28E0